MPDNKLTHPTLVKEAVEHSRSELAYYRGQGVPLENISVSLRGDLLEALLASLPTDDDDSWQPIETAPKDGDDILVEWFEGGTMLVVSWDDEQQRWTTLDGPSYHPEAFKAWKRLPKPSASIHTLIGRGK